MSDELRLVAVLRVEVLLPSDDKLKESLIK
jgi:hypothetical protein